MRSVETAIGLMKNLQTSIVVEETWVEKQTEKLQALPTATAARELDVSILSYNPLFDTVQCNLVLC